jgi:hypothetical protein
MTTVEVNPGNQRKTHSKNPEFFLSFADNVIKMTSAGGVTSQAIFQNDKEQVILA